MKEITIHKRCTSCEVGELQYQRGSGILASNPPQYRHECGKCGIIKNYFKKYPYTYLEVEEHEKEERWED